MIDRNPAVAEEELHAYVDGELAPDRRVAVEAWLASHPEDAARVAQWRSQADAIRARFGMLASEPVPARFDLDNLARGARSWRGAAACAPAGDTASRPAHRRRSARRPAHRTAARAP